MFCFVFLVIIILGYGRSYAQRNILNDFYFERMKNIFMNCSMDYKMHCTYPDSMKMDISGRVAVQGSNYYDSSDVRFLFINDKWYISADHESKFLSISYLPKLNEEFEGLGQVNFISYLYNDNNFLDRLSVVLSGQQNDTAWADFKVNGGESKIEMFRVKFLKSTLVPLEYKAIVNFPLDEDADDPLTVRIAYTCTHIVYPAPRSIFDDSRLITYSGDRATLKRYNNYKTTFNNSKNNSNGKK